MQAAVSCRVMGADLGGIRISRLPLAPFRRRRTSEILPRLSSTQQTTGRHLSAATRRTVTPSRNDITHYTPLRRSHVSLSAAQQ